MFNGIRVKIIKFIIDINERIFFEKRLHNYYKKNINIKTVIDVGANKGQSIDFFLRLNADCKIYAIEPNPKLYNLLVEKYKGNKNIQIFNLGISDHSGEKLFFENVFDYTSSFEELNYDSKYLEKKAKILGIEKENIISNKYPVSVKTLQDIIKENNIVENIDVIKIDTEGHEYYCLQGLFKDKEVNNIQYIQLENHNDDMYASKISFSQIESYLLENKFKNCMNIKHGFGDFSEVIFKKMN